LLGSRNLQEGVIVEGYETVEVLIGVVLAVLLELFKIGGGL